MDTATRKKLLGVKRICESCHNRFYDLSRSPIVCPSCNEEFVIEKVSEDTDADEAVVDNPSLSPDAKDSAVAGIVADVSDTVGDDLPLSEVDDSGALIDSPDSDENVSGLLGESIIRSVPEPQDDDKS